jgi:hypothetical protein
MFGSTTPSASSAHVPEYDHTQWAPMYLLLLVPGLTVLFLSAVLIDEPSTTLGVTLIAMFLLLIAYSFRSLHVVDECNALALKFGPIPLFRKRFPYAHIFSADCDRSTVIDGWGIHWIPGRGWIYNLWGFDCVRLILTGNRTVRVGTDDPEGLASFLKEKCRR